MGPPNAHGGGGVTKDDIMGQGADKMGSSDAANVGNVGANATQSCPSDPMTMLSDIRDLLSESFVLGCDGLGSVNLSQHQAASLFRNPLKFSPSDFVDLIKLSKEQFVRFVNTCVIPHTKKMNLSLLAQAFLFLLKENVPCLLNNGDTVQAEVINFLRVPMQELQ